MRISRNQIRVHRGAALGVIYLGWSFLGCQKEAGSPVPSERPPVERVSARAVETPAPVRTASDRSQSDGNPQYALNSALAVPPPKVWGRADLDPENDKVVAPPEAVPECHARLDTAGVKFRKAELPLKQVVRDIPTCGCHDAVTVSETPEGMKLVPPAVVSCQVALALVGLESVIQEIALQHLKEKVRTLHQGGTYSCRKMARFDLVSEHSYGNAIDVFAFTLESGEKVSVLTDFGPLNSAPEGLSPRARFLRELSSAVYDREIMSVSLSPYWDNLHRDHFHFDMARYRVDGSRPH